LAERALLVDKRHVDSLRQELVQARSTLNRERDERRSVEETAQQLRVREMELLSAQSELQSEARSLAVELAQRTASVDAVSALRSRPATFSPTALAAASPSSGSLLSDSFSAPNTPHHRDASVMHVVGSAKPPRLASYSAEQVPVGLRAPADTLRSNSNGTSTDLFKMISEIDSRISTALRHH
jgi:hypothetical protein